MAIMATLPGTHHLFTNLPTTDPPPPSSSHAPPPRPPIPIPKYLPPRPKKPPGLKTSSRYHKPVKPGQEIPGAGDRAVVIGENGVSYRLPGAPFDFQFSYSETPRAEPLAIREPAFLPFAPPSMPRPWTGKAPVKKATRNIKLFRGKGVTPVGAPLNREEIRDLLKPYISSNRHVNLGVGGVVYMFRGRYYNPGTRPRYPVVLWKPATPVYPKLQKV